MCFLWWPVSTWAPLFHTQLISTRAGWSFLKLSSNLHLSNIPLFCIPFRLNYILGYHTTYVGTPQALQLRDETMAILRMAVEH